MCTTLTCNYSCQVQLSFLVQLKLEVITSSLQLDFIFSAANFYFCSTLLLLVWSTKAGERVTLLFELTLASILILTFVLCLSIFLGFITGMVLVLGLIVNLLIIEGRSRTKQSQLLPQPLNLKHCDLELPL